MDTNKNYSFGQQPTGCQHGGASLELKCTLCAEIALAYLRAENKKLRAVRGAAAEYVGMTRPPHDGESCECVDAYEALCAALDDAKEIE